MQGDGDQRLTGGVGEFILLALDPVLKAFCIASCSGNFVLHLLVGHFRRHVSRLAVLVEAEKSEGRWVGWTQSAGMEMPKSDRVERLRRRE